MSEPAIITLEPADDREEEEEPLEDEADPLRELRLLFREDWLPPLLFFFLSSPFLPPFPPPLTPGRAGVPVRWALKST